MISYISNKLDSYGVQCFSNHTLTTSDGKPKNYNSISHHVMENILKKHNEDLKNSAQYIHLHRRSTKAFSRPNTHDYCNSKIHNYLWGHSIRKGYLGKLAGLVYKIVEFAKEVIWGSSDRTTALEEIESFLFMKNQVISGTYKHDYAAAVLPTVRIIPEETRFEAESILKTMLVNYNQELHNNRLNKQS